jgi:hypothetical protein
MGKRQARKPVTGRTTNRADRKPAKAFEMAPLSPLLNNPNWVLEFQRLVRRVLTLTQELEQYYNLPGFPRWLKITDLRNTFGWLRAHLSKVDDDSKRRVEKRDFSFFGVEEKIAHAYQWACSLIKESTPELTPWETLYGATHRKVLSWLPTRPERGAWQGILDWLAHFDLEGSVAESGSEERDPDAIRPEGMNASLPDRESDRQIVETLRAVGQRLTTSQLLSEMSNRRLNPSESTIKKRLAELVRLKWLDNDPKARPKGYGLRERNGSSGSDGS